MLNKKSIPIVMTLMLIVLLTPGINRAESAPPLTHKLTAVNKVVSAPNLRLQNMDEEFIDIKDLKGKVVVINFWATWCPPCRREMGSLERLHQAVKGKNVEVIAVNIGEDLDTVFSFIGTVEPSPEFQFVFDPEGSSMTNWKVRGLPTTFIIDPDGKIAYRAVGGREFDHPDIQKAVINLGR